MSKTELISAKQLWDGIHKRDDDSAGRENEMKPIWFFLMFLGTSIVGMICGFHVGYNQGYQEGQAVTMEVVKEVTNEWEARIDSLKATIR